MTMGLKLKSEGTLPLVFSPPPLSLGIPIDRRSIEVLDQGSNRVAVWAVDPIESRGGPHVSFDDLMTDGLARPDRAIIAGG